MPDSSTNIYLDSCLAPLEPFLSRHDVTDLYINRPGEIWIECLGQPPLRHAVPTLTEDLLSRLSRQIAAASAQGINRAHPLLAASLPTGERVQIVLPPATRGTIAIAIRQHVAAERDLEDYGWADDGATPMARTPQDNAPVAGVEEVAVSSQVDLLRQAVRERRNILVSGGTSTGKTTFLNSLIREIPRDERLIFIEDTAELKIAHPNAVGLIAARGQLGEASLHAEDLLIAALRMRPDRIILGEVRGSEAMTFLRAINTGHPGSLSTIHADTPQGAIDQLIILALQAGSRMRWEDMERYIRRSVDVIVQLHRRNGRRMISNIVHMG